MEECLLTSENIGLYSECRVFLIYIKENHGGIFRSAVFSSLVDPEKKLKIIKEKYSYHNHELSDDINESINEQLPTEEGQSTINNKLKTKETRLTTESLIGGDDQSSYTNQNGSLYVDLTLVQMGLLRLNFLVESCPPGSVPDPQFLNSLLILVCFVFSI